MQDDIETIECPESKLASPYEWQINASGIKYPFLGMQSRILNASGCMAVAKRLAAYDTGYDEKYDSPTNTQRQTWLPASHTARAWFRKRRIVQFALALVAVYFFIKYLPTDLPTAGQRIDSRTGLRQGPAFSSEHPSNRNLPDKSQLYDGQVRFYNLAISLRQHTHVHNGDKRSLVFLLCDLRAASSLIQLACQMGSFNRTIVHLAVISREDIPVPDIVSVMNINPAECPVWWHDARPDYNSKSSAARQIRSIESAMDHLHASLQSSAFVIDESQLSNLKLKSVLQEKSMSLWTPLMIAPRDAATSADWITTLDGYAFSLLNTVKVDILITAYHSSAGSLIKLLESIKQAYYGGLPPPRITVELPPDVDSFALKYLEDFKWPGNSLSEGHRLVLRRRINSHAFSPTNASVHILESFYPSSPYMSHLLVLSPDVELSNDYFQYLMYTISEYKYGSAGLGLTDSLIGISLDLPRKFSDSGNSINRETKHQHPLAISHAPSNIAVLYFGDKWTELQNYVSLRLSNDPTLIRSVPGHADASDEQPSWLRLASEFMTAGGYVMLYPVFVKDQASPFVTVHQQFHQNPEEYANLLDKKPKPKPIPTLKDDTVLVADETTSHAHLGHKQMSSAAQSLRSRMGIRDHDPLPSGLGLPFVTADGKVVDVWEAQSISRKFAEELSLSVGGCKALEDRDKTKVGRVEYFFCSYDKQDKI